MYISLWKAVVLGGGLLWASFLVLQGRYCTGIDGQVTGGGTPIVGNLLPPKDSLILRNAPGCAFGAAWQNIDLEGKVLASVFLSISSFLAALVFSLFDQIMLLLFACFYRCNSVGIKRSRYLNQHRDDRISPLKTGIKSERDVGGNSIIDHESPRILCSCTIRGEVTCSSTRSRINGISSSSSSSSLFGVVEKPVVEKPVVEKPFNTDLVFVPESWIDLKRYPTRRIDCCVRQVKLLKQDRDDNSNTDEDTESNQIPLRRRQVDEEEGSDGRYNDDKEDEEVFVGVVITVPGLIQVTMGFPKVV
jgi:hypothetical protein